MLLLFQWLMAGLYWMISREAIAAIERAGDVRSSYVSTYVNSAVSGEDREDSFSSPTERSVFAVEDVYYPDAWASTDIPINLNNITNTSNTEKRGADAQNGVSVPHLGERVVNVRCSGVPLGLRGTITAIHQHTAYVEVRKYEYNHLHLDNDIITMTVTVTMYIMYVLLRYYLMKKLSVGRACKAHVLNLEADYFHGIVSSLFTPLGIR